MTETIKPEPTEPADPGTDEASKPEPGDSFLAPDDANADETGGSGGGERPKKPSVPPPPD